MSSPKSEYMSKLNELGIQAFFIVSENGFPIIDRIYNPSDLGVSGNRVETLTSMMSTVVRFNQNLIQNGLLSDIGLHTSRIFFDYLQEIIFVLLVDENSLAHYELFNVQTILKGTISNVKSLFQSKLGMDDGIEDPDMMDIESLKENFGKDILEKVDEMIYTSYTELLQALL